MACTCGAKSFRTNYGTNRQDNAFKFRLVNVNYIAAKENPILSINYSSGIESFQMATPLWRFVNLEIQELNPIIF